MTDHPCVVSGYSDDLIEVDGVISEEFPLPADGEVLLAFSTGVVLRVTFTAQGVWRIRPVCGDSRVDLVVAPEDDEDNYSDKAYLTQPPAWVVVGTAMARASA